MHPHFASSHVYGILPNKCTTYILMHKIAGNINTCRHETTCAETKAKHCDVSHRCRISSRTTESTWASFLLLLAFNNNARHALTYLWNTHLPKPFTVLLIMCVGKSDSDIEWKWTRTLSWETRFQRKYKHTAGLNCSPVALGARVGSLVVRNTKYICSRNNSDMGDMTRISITRTGCFELAHRGILFDNSAWIRYFNCMLHCRVRAPHGTEAY